MSRDYNILRDIIGMNRDIRVGKLFVIISIMKRSSFVKKRLLERKKKQIPIGTIGASI